MNDNPASGERVQKYVFNFEIYRFAKKNGQFTPSCPTWKDGTKMVDFLEVSTRTSLDY